MILKESAEDGDERHDARIEPTMPLCTEGHPIGAQIALSIDRAR